MILLFIDIARADVGLRAEEIYYIGLLSVVFCEYNISEERMPPGCILGGAPRDGQ